MKICCVLILISILALFSACTQTSKLPEPKNAYLIKVNSDNCLTNNNFLNYENDTISVVYVFWAEKGIMGILIHNKIKQPIYVDWRKCSFIVGTTKHDYWNETIEVKTSGTSSGSEQTRMSTWGKVSIYKLFLENVSSSFSNSFSSRFFSSITTLTKPERITFIPPGTTISMSNFPILGNNILNINRGNIFTIDTTVLIKGHYEEMGNNIIRYIDSTTTEKVSLSCINYNKEETPYSFRSFLTYSTDENFSKESYIDNSFYISNVIVMTLSIFINSRKIGETINNDDYNMWAAPNSFYIFE